MSDAEKWGHSNCLPNELCLASYSFSICFRISFSGDPLLQLEGVAVNEGMNLLILPPVLPIKIFFH